jgi:hypothetical protein
MARGARVTVSNVAVKLVRDGCVARIKNRDGANSISLGGPGVLAGQGYELKFGEETTVDARAEPVFAIRDTLDVRVDVIETRGIQS